jgi:hypothetical protein
VTPSSGRAVSSSSAPVVTVVTTATADRSRRALWPLAIALFFACAVQAALVWRLVPIPTTDESLYKGVAYELAAHGRFALPQARGFYSGVESRFIPYPPVFIGALAGWYRLVGFGAFQSQLFTAVLRLGAAGLAGLLAHRLADRHRDAWSVIACLAVFSYCRADRPDPLAVVLALVALALAIRQPRTRSTVLCAGLCAAGALSVEPATVLLYGPLLVVYAWRSEIPRPVLRVAAAVAAGACLAAVGVSLALSHASMLRYYVALAVGKLRSGHDATALRVLLHESTRFWAPWLLLFAALGLHALVQRRRAPLGGDAGALTAGTGAAFAVFLVAAPGQHHYLMLLYPFAVLSVAIWGSRLAHERSALCAASACLAAGWTLLVLDTGRAFAMETPDLQATTKSAIESRIPSGVLVAADGGLWTLLVARNDFRDLRWGRVDVPRADWVVSLGAGSGTTGVTTFEKGPYARLAASGYTVVYDGLVPRPQRLLGIPLGHSRLGWGVRIYRRKGST